MLLSYWGTRESVSRKYPSVKEQRAYRTVHNAVFDAAELAIKLARKHPKRTISLFVPWPTNDEKAINEITIRFGDCYGPQMTFQWEDGGKSSTCAV